MQAFDLRTTPNLALGYQNTTTKWNRANKQAEH